MSKKLKSGVQTLRDKLAEKRRKKEPETQNFINVQLLSSEPSGTTQKYKRIGALESVVIDETPTLQTLKEACLRHFGSNKKKCDILLSERGPSARNISQINLKKVVHCRLVMEEKVDEPASVSETPNSHSDASENETPKSQSALQQVSTVSQSIVTQSIPYSVYIKAGQAVRNKRKIVELLLEEYDVAGVKWNTAVTGKFILETEEYARGGFRQVFKCKCFGGEFPTGWYVMKEFIVDAEVGVDREDTMRRNVQMHMVARHLAKRMSNEAPEEFGLSFYYEKAFFAFCNGEPVSIEKFSEGNFEKYINNNAEFESNDTERFLKAETFMHFSYKRTEESLMVTDIQGFGYHLTDPEIASNEENEGNKPAFCPGNCAMLAITNFFTNHSCNKYCKQLEL